MLEDQVSIPTLTQYCHYEKYEKATEALGDISHSRSRFLNRPTALTRSRFKNRCCKLLGVAVVNCWVWPTYEHMEACVTKLSSHLLFATSI